MDSGLLQTPGRASPRAAPPDSSPAPAPQELDDQLHSRTHSSPASATSTPGPGDSGSPFAEITTSAFNSGGADLPPLHQTVPDSGPNRAATAPTDGGKDPNSSVHSVAFGSSTTRPFATPLKLLPPLKDIEPIVTPKSFGVAKDVPKASALVGNDEVGARRSPPILPEVDEDVEDAFDASANDTFAKAPEQGSGRGTAAASHLEAAAAFVGLEPSQFMLLGEDLVARLAQRAHAYQGVQSELSFFKLNQEHLNLVHAAKYDALHKKMTRLALLNDTLSAQNETLTEKMQQSGQTTAALSEQVTTLSQKVRDAENAQSRLQLAQEDEVRSRDDEIARLHAVEHKLTKSNVKLSQLVSQLTKDLSEEASAKFLLKLDLTKASNELAYTLKQKEWYAQQLKAVQDKYTELIKKHETEYLQSTSQHEALALQHEYVSAAKQELEARNKDLLLQHDSMGAKILKLEAGLKADRAKFAKELAANEEIAELRQIQLQEREERIKQLEQYADELKEQAGGSLGKMQRVLDEREETIAALEVKLKRTEDALGGELQKDADLPRVSASAEAILKSSSLCISLLALYTEFTMAKKEIVLERTQKEKLATQLQHFVAELESRKPAIANYRAQVQFYEKSLKEHVDKMEALRAVKTAADKECGRLRARLGAVEAEKAALKQLLQDLGRQLCYYLIHSNLKESHDAPLTASERRVIDQILAKSGAGDGAGDTDTDVLISERLVVFANVAELQKRNEELVAAVRQLGRELEHKDLQAVGLELAAVDEAKDAILTLQSELDSVTARLDAVTQECDMLRASGSLVGDTRGADVRALADTNAELMQRVKELDAAQHALQQKSETRVRELTEKLAAETGAGERLRAEVASAKHAAQLAESRLVHAQSVAESTQKMAEHVRSEVEFWKRQAAKQEEMLVAKSNALRDEEQRVGEVGGRLHDAQVEREQLSAAHDALRAEIERVRADKMQLGTFVASLQALLAEREASAQDLTSKLLQSLVNYQTLQERISEKDERIQVLSAQAELALKAQNLKLEQVGQLSQRMLEAKTQLGEKSTQVEQCRRDLEQCRRELERRKSRTSPDDAAVFDGASVLRLEYEDVKAALSDAEQQVHEFSGIARAAEDALQSAAASHAEYKTTMEQTVRALENDKQALAGSVGAKEADANALRDTIRVSEDRFRAELLQLQAQLQETAYKAQAYDDMKRDMERQLDAVAADLRNQVTLHSDLAQRCDAKAHEAEQLNEQVARQKDEMAAVQGAAAEAAEQLRRAREQKAAAEAVLGEKQAAHDEELQAAKARITDLECQYNLALNQVELQAKAAVSGADSGADDTDMRDELRQVVRFLRREKDSAGARAEQLAHDAQTLRTELDRVSFELATAKAQQARLETHKVNVDASAQEHARLMEQLDQLNLLRESNVTLRAQGQELQRRAEAAEAALRAKEQKSAAPASGNTAAVQEQEMRLVHEENERLRERLAGNEDYKQLMQRFENLKAEFKTKLQAHRNRNKELERQIEARDAEAQKAPETEKEMAMLKDQTAKLAAEKDSAVKKLAAEKDAALRKVEDEKNVAKKLAAEKDAALKKLADVELRLDKAADADAENIADFDAERKKLAAASDAEKKRLAAEHDKKIAALQEKFEERLAREKKSVEASAEKKCEFKLRVLNRKLERFERDRKEREGKRPLPGGKPAAKKAKDALTRRET